MGKKQLKTFAIIFIFCLLFFAPFISRAASLGFSPSTLSRTIRSTFSVVVYVSSPDRSMNAASGVVSFPTDKLEVVSVSKTNSVMNLWVQEPTFSNSQGTVNFEGIALNPGFTGNQGNIINITFRAKSAGVANVNFTSGSVLANDGAGTNILENLGNASFSIAQGATKEIPSVPSAPAPIVSATSGNAPIITSTTHPDQAKWYSNNTPEFSWQLPKNALEARTLIGKSSTSTPTVRYTPPISTKKVDALSDGTYYFSLQVRTTGGWSEIGRYRVNVDTTPPKPFSITFPHGRKILEPRPIILFNATDGESGIEYYTVKIGSGGPERVALQTESNPYSLPPQYPGKHTVTVAAIDEAGNTRSASEDFEIKAIESPIITYYQEEVESGDTIKINGTTYPDSNITILLKEDDKVFSEEYAKSNSLGDLTVVSTKRFNPGVYTFTARVKDSLGAQSNETPVLTITVKSRFLTYLTELFLNYLSAALLAILGLAALVGGGGYVWYRSFGVIRRMRRESKEAEKMLEKSFHLLRKDIDEHIALLKKAKLKRQLSSEEIAFLEHFEEELAEAEDVVVKEVGGISSS